MSQKCKLVTHRLLTSEERIRSLVTSLHMLCVLSHHTAKQFRVFVITSNKVHFVKNFSRKKCQRITTDGLQ